MTEFVMRPRMIEREPEQGQLAEALHGSRSKKDRVRSSASIALASSRTQKPARSMEGETLNDVSGAL